MSFEEYIGASDPEPELQRIAEMVRQGVEGDFWRWLVLAIRAESQADILALADPKTPPEMVQFLRGKIRARNEDLLLPKEFVERYDFVRGTDAPASQDLDTPGAPRRLSPVREDEEDAGQPGNGSFGHPEVWSD